MGHSVEDRLLLFQGPIGLNWLNGRLEYGSVEDFTLPSRSRIGKWINASIHVKDRPEWVFVKVYSHGIQSAEAIVENAMPKMLDDLEDICKGREINLHYMTAREAYNVVKAAEAGESGNPDDYRDYRIPKPRNMLFST